jgi:hypothetical protein
MSSASSFLCSVWIYNHKLTHCRHPSCDKVPVMSETQVFSKIASATRLLFLLLVGTVADTTGSISDAVLPLIQRSIQKITPLLVGSHFGFKASYKDTQIIGLKVSIVSSLNQHWNNKCNWVKWTITKPEQRNKPKQGNKRHNHRLRFRAKGAHGLRRLQPVVKANKI